MGLWPRGLKAMPQLRLLNYVSNRCCKGDRSMPGVMGHASEVHRVLVVRCWLGVSPTKCGVLRTVVVQTYRMLLVVVAGCGLLTWVSYACSKGAHGT